jgi:GNAT superfamily N-acetyltransferase
MSGKARKYCIEQNLIDFYLSFKDNPAVSFVENKQLYSLKNQITAWPNYIFIKKNQEQDFGSTLQLVTRHITETNNGDFLLLDSETAFQHENLLRQQSYFPVKLWTGMKLETSEPFDLINSKLDIVSVYNTTRLLAWIKLVNEVFYNKELLTPELADKFLSHPNYTLYMGFVDKELATTCLVFDNDESIGLYYIATRAEHRKQGFAGNIVKTVLNNCIKKGKNKFVLHATKNAVGIYGKLGFTKHQGLITFAKKQL